MGALNTNRCKIIVAHPGKQHSYRIAGALQKSGMLAYYVTTVYNNNSRLMRFVKCLLKPAEKKRAEGRSTDLIHPNNIKQICELRGLILLALIRLDKNRGIYNLYNDHVARVFGRRVAKLAIKSDVNAIVCYDASASFCFKTLKKQAPNIIRIIDNAAMNRYGLFRIYNELDKQYGILDEKKGFKPYLVNEQKALRFKEEAELADYHIVASSFSKYSLTKIGIPENKVFVIPYGVDTEKISRKTKYNTSKKLKFLYVGEISRQKGISTLLNAADKYFNVADFVVVGSGCASLSEEIQMKIKEKTIYYGYLLQSELFKLYQECDVFVFPTLGDGFGFVVIEAMTAGLPVICSSNSIGRDAVTDMENGFVFQAGDDDSFIDRIGYFISNRDEVERMGNNASLVAKSFTWEKYEKSVNDTLNKIVR